MLPVLVRKQIPSKEIPLGTGEILKETKNMLEDENYKQARTRIRGPLKNKEMIRDKLMSTGDPLNKKEILRDENGKQVRAYAGAVSTGMLSNA